jgi:hypothetical protein
MKLSKMNEDLIRQRIYGASVIGDADNKAAGMGRVPVKADAVVSGKHIKDAIDLGCELQKVGNMLHGPAFRAMYALSRMPHNGKLESKDLDAYTFSQWEKAYALMIISAKQELFEGYRLLGPREGVFYAIERQCLPATALKCSKLLRLMHLMSRQGFRCPISLKLKVVSIKQYPTGYVQTDGTGISLTKTAAKALNTALNDERDKLVFQYTHLDKAATFGSKGTGITADLEEPGQMVADARCEEEGLDGIYLLEEMKNFFGDLPEIGAIVTLDESNLFIMGTDKDFPLSRDTSFSLDSHHFDGLEDGTATFGEKLEAYLQAAEVCARQVRNELQVLEQHPDFAGVRAAKMVGGMTRPRRLAEMGFNAAPNSMKEDILKAVREALVKRCYRVDIPGRRGYVQATKLANDKCVLSRAYADQLGVEVGDRILIRSFPPLAGRTSYCATVHEIIESDAFWVALPGGKKGSMMLLCRDTDGDSLNIVRMKFKANFVPDPEANYSSKLKPGEGPGSVEEYLAKLRATNPAKAAKVAAKYEDKYEDELGLNILERGKLTEKAIGLSCFYVRTAMWWCLSIGRKDLWLTHAVALICYWQATVERAKHLTAYDPEELCEYIIHEVFGGRADLTGPGLPLELKNGKLALRLHPVERAFSWLDAGADKQLDNDGFKAFAAANLQGVVNPEVRRLAYAKHLVGQLRGTVLNERGLPVINPVPATYLSGPALVYLNAVANIPADIEIETLDDMAFVNDALAFIAEQAPKVRRWWAINEFVLNAIKVYNIARFNLGKNGTAAQHRDMEFKLAMTIFNSGIAKTALEKVLVACVAIASYVEDEKKGTIINTDMVYAVVLGADALEEVEAYVQGDNDFEHVEEVGTVAQTIPDIAVCVRRANYKASKTELEVRAYLGANPRGCVQVVKQGNDFLIDGNVAATVGEAVKDNITAAYVPDGSVGYLLRPNPYRKTIAFRLG